MTRFVVTLIYRVPPDALARWWLDYREDDVRLEADLKSRRVERIDATHIHLVNDMVRGRRKVHLDGVVTITGPLDWFYTSEITVDESPFARELSSFHVEAQGTVDCKLIASFEWTPKSLLARIALPLIKGSLRREREEAYAGYGPSVEAERRVPGEHGSGTD